MERIRVMVAEDNPRVADAIREYLDGKEDTEVVHVLRDGTSAADAVRAYRPDVVLTDIVMPHKDGFTAMEEMLSLPEEIRPKVIVLSGLNRDDFILRALNIGAAYYMVKPFDLEVLYTRIREIGRTAAPTQKTGREFSEERAANVFLTLGIPAHIKGYRYLCEGVKMVAENPALMNRITKELYPGIAEHFDTSPSRVERAMRHAIDIAWNRERFDAANKLFGYPIFSARDKPGNGEFIALIAQL